MRRLRHGSLLVFFFLTLFLHCAQLCLAAGHTHGEAPRVTSPNHDPEHAPCHPPPVFPRKTSEHCPNCGSHFFLRMVPAGAETQAVSELLLPLFCLLTQQPLPSLAQGDAGISRLSQVAAPPRYLTLSVLRL